MAYGKSGGCTPITAKIQKTTKGGVVQPILNVGKVSPAKMKGDLNKDGKMSGYEQTRQNAIDKATSSPAKFIKPSSMVTRIASGAIEGAKHRARAQDSGYGGNLATAYGFVKGFLSGKSDSGKSAPKTDSSSKAPKSNKNSKPKYNTSIKNYGLNTQARRDEYTRRGWKQDATTTIKGAPKDTSSSKTKEAKANPFANKKINADDYKIEALSIADTIKNLAKEPKSTKQTKKVETTKKQPTRREVNVARRKQASIDKKLSKAAEARKAGNIDKALRKEQRAAKKAARIAKKAKK